MATECHLPSELVLWITRLAQPLHARLAGRLLTICVGMLFARGRRTVASWLRGAEVGNEFRPHYYFLGSLGRKSKWVAVQLLHLALKVVGVGDRMLFALDDSPTKRQGPRVEGAGIHHNPTPGPAEQKFLYGHVWVSLALVVRHAWWGTIALPLLALLYVRKKDISKLPPWYKIPFQTKLEMAAEMIRWLALWLGSTGKRIWIVADGGYAKRPVFEAVREAKATLVTRLRKDARLSSLPKTPPLGRRGPKPKYGKDKISLAKRAAHPLGWQTAAFVLYNETVTKTYKTFLATYRPAGGLVRVVIVKEDNGDWRAYACTDPEATVAEILEAVADRAALEQVYHDVKEVHGAGQQQVRNYWVNIAVYNLTLWWHTLVELWAWNKGHEELCDRSASPWDDPTRRPSHADRHNALRRHTLEEEIRTTQGAAATMRQFSNLLRRLVTLAA
jgi:DDE superfamily endonuclease